MFLIYFDFFNKIEFTKYLILPVIIVNIVFSIKNEIKLCSVSLTRMFASPYRICRVGQKNVVRPPTFEMLIASPQSGHFPIKSFC